MANSPAKYNSRDLLTYWKKQFEIHNLNEYVSLRWGGMDLSDFKSLLLEHDVFEILLGIDEAVKHGTIISEFCENFEEYDTDSVNARLEWLVKSKGKAKHKKIWNELEKLSFIWFPKGKQAYRKSQLEAELEEWAK